MSRTVDFPEGLLVHIQDDEGGRFSVRRKGWNEGEGDQPLPVMEVEEGNRPLRALLNFGIWDAQSGDYTKEDRLVTLVARYFRSDYERAGGKRPTLLLWVNSEWVPAESLVPKEKEPKADYIGSDEAGLIIVRDVPIADPPAAMG
ncbi:MAG: hypothetical protein R3300_09950 [Candidatus Promineifilaceae bacterium]|nr:hypothetical protein [Candidatus Promineifilaceae bacterium]